VASMVVFVDGAPAKKRYRSFRIKGLGALAQGDRQNDDFASMYEVLARRLRRANITVDPALAAEGAVAPATTSEDISEDVEGVSEDMSEEPGDPGADAWALPDLMVIDGGKGQL